MTVSIGKWEVKKAVSIEKELELINTYTRSELKQEDVYIFTLTLCDNEVDRDYERFSAEALTALAGLFKGKTGIFDHSMRSKDQRARIFRTYIEKAQGKKTSVGEAYTALKARAYMLRTEENASLIKEIEGGIKKEVSVGCSMKECICSVCGKDMKRHQCEHIKGRTYDGKICHGILKEPTDAYEWSFVAVPAQKMAGVTKSFNNFKERKEKMTIESFKSISQETLFSADEIESLKSQIEDLELLAKEAGVYRDQLTRDIRKYALIIMPSVDVKSFISGCEKMGISEIKALRDSMLTQANSVLPVKPQLSSAKDEKTNYDYSQFKI